PAAPNSHRAEADAPVRVLLADLDVGELFGRDADPPALGVGQPEHLHLAGHGRVDLLDELVGTLVGLDDQLLGAVDHAELDLHPCSSRLPLWWCASGRPPRAKPARAEQASRPPRRCHGALLRCEDVPATGRRAMEWAVLAVAVAVVAGGAVGLWAGPRLRGGGLAAGVMLERGLEGMSNDLDRRLAALDQRLWLGLDSVQHAQAQAADTAADVRERVATVAGLAEQVLDHARE